MCKVKKFEEPVAPREGSKPIYYYENENGCYICISHRHDRDGYARIDRNGREWQLHRYTYYITYGDIPDKMVVRHRCDNPECCNPLHLELGTQLENMRDMVLRNIQRKIATRLTKKEKTEIAKSKRTIRELAKIFNVSHAAIVVIKRNFRKSINNRMAPDKPMVDLSEAKSAHKKKASNF